MFLGSPFAFLADLRKQMDIKVLFILYLLRVPCTAGPAVIRRGNCAHMDGVFKIYAVQQLSLGLCSRNGVIYPAW